MQGQLAPLAPCKPAQVQGKLGHVLDRMQSASSQRKTGCGLAASLEAACSPQDEIPTLKRHGGPLLPTPPQLLLQNGGGPILPLAGLPLYSSKTAWPDQSIRGSNKSSLPARAENPEASTGVWSAQWWGARFPAAGLAASVCPLAFLGPPRPGLDLTFWPGALLPNDSRKGGGGRTANLDASSSSLFRIIMPGDVS